ncbi:MAG TPA: aspartate kinase [Bacillota bacterium]|nr:aspartate kinase [Bacillota bacterium]
MGLVVQKYGGSSIADATCMINVAKRIGQRQRDGDKVVVVLSAQGDTTDKLIAKASEINDNPSKRELDRLLSTGEHISISLMAMALESLGYQAVSLTGRQVSIRTDGSYGSARIESICSERIEKELDEGKIVIVAGFQGIDENGNVTTLGRGGSDTSAVALAAALEADYCEIYTDVDGIYTADPRIVKDARKLDEVTYSEMLELASLGARVLKNRSVELADNYKVKLVVRSSLNKNEGTIIKESTSMERTVIKGVTYDTDTARITVIGVSDIPGIAHRIFKLLADAGINVDVIVQSSGRDDTKDISFTVQRSQLSDSVKVINKNLEYIGAKKVSFTSDVAKVSIVGAGMTNHPGVAAAMFEALSETDINIKMISTSEIKVSCIIGDDKVERAVQAIHDKFKLGNGQASKA